MTEPVPAGTSLVDLLDRVVNTGVALTGDAVISLAGIDLIRLDLRLLLVGVDSALRLEEQA
jgi:gas vesicle protein GvpA/GvpJ/GvpM family